MSTAVKTKEKSKAIAKRNAAHQRYKKAWDKYQKRKTPGNRKKLVKAKDEYQYWVDTIAELGKKSKFERADNYRQEFLKENPGILFGHYMCIYCFRIIPKERMQVDHLVAVNRLKKNPLWKLLFMFSKDGVNTTMNLYPACATCNNHKKDKGGTWIIRGQIGGIIWRILQGLQKIIHKVLTSKWFYLILIAGAAFVVLSSLATGASAGGVMWEIIRDILTSLL